jgi:hypothetical protein
MRLYHYTCFDHGDPGIQRDGFLRPKRHILIGKRLIWLTSLEQPEMLGLGLTHDTISCDRTAVRYEVSTPYAVRWSRWARQNKVPADLRRDLESLGMPDCWWVAERVLPVVDRVALSEVSA